MKSINGIKLHWLPFNIFVVIIGILAYFLIVGPLALQPTNIAWLEQGDPAQHYLGWQFFRYSDWSFPIGLNPNYGLDISNAIIFSDSNPLLAFLFKPFSKYLPEPFQYFGIWLLICFILQAWFSAKLIGLVTRSQVIILLGGCLFCFAPPMLGRIHGHFSLVGHFLILASLYLALSPSPNRRILSWAGLLVACALTHAYLLAMVGLVWSADIVDRVIKRSLRPRRAVLEAALIFCVTFLACWQAGYFSVSDGVIAEGYGYYRMNLLSILDPTGWSYVLCDIPQSSGDYEGFNYLGLGILFLGLSVIPILIDAQTGIVKAIINRPVLLFAMVLLAIFALSNTLGLAALNFYFPIPEPLLVIANIFRSSGRMFWPVFYIMVFLIIFLVIRGYSKNVAATLLVLGLLIQIVDTSSAWKDLMKKRRVTPNSAWPTKMVDPFWKEAATKYKQIRHVMPENFIPSWQTTANYAGVNHLSTDAVYLARVSSAAVASAQKLASEAIRSGRYQSDSLYILEPRFLPQAALTLNAKNDLLAQIDDFFVIAPGWKICSSCSKVSGEIKVDDFLAPPLRLGERLVFSTSQLGLKYLVYGWSIPEEWGTWSDGSEALIKLPPFESHNARKILLEVQPLLSPAHHKQSVELSINGVSINPVVLTDNSGRLLEIEIPEVVRQQLQQDNPPLNLQFYFPDAVRPVDIGMNIDSRKLAVRLISLTVH